MRHLLKKSATLCAAAAGAAFLLGGCGQKFDEQAYVKACLDAIYMEDYQEYADQIGVTVEEAKSDLDGQFQDSLDSAFLGDTVTSEEDKEAYKNVILDIYKLAKYEVTGSEANGDDYIVTVEVQPSNVFENLESGYAEKIEAKVTDGTYDESKSVSYLTEYLEEAIAANEYGDPVEVEVNVVGDADNVYTIPESDLTDIESALFPGAV